MSPRYGFFIFSNLLQHFLPSFPFLFTSLYPTVEQFQQFLQTNKYRMKIHFALCYSINSIVAQEYSSYHYYYHFLFLVKIKLPTYIDKDVESFPDNIRDELYRFAKVYCTFAICWRFFSLIDSNFRSRMFNKIRNGQLSIHLSIYIGKYTYLPVFSFDHLRIIGQGIWVQRRVRSIAVAKTRNWSDSKAVIVNVVPTNVFNVHGKKSYVLWFFKLKLKRH